MDAVLLCFTVEAKRDRPATFAAAQVFVSQAFEKLHAHISTLLKQVRGGRGRITSSVRRSSFPHHTSAALGTPASSSTIPPSPLLVACLPLV